MDEVLRVIQYLKACREAKIDCTITIDKCKTHLVLNVLRKAIQRKPKEKGCAEKTHYYCPNCGFIPLTIYADGYHLGNKPNYCERCGQAIDWTEVD